MNLGLNSRRVRFSNFSDDVEVCDKNFKWIMIIEI